jgi:hypothetical protein
MWVTLHTVVERQKCIGSLCMPVYTDTDKGMGFPVLQRVFTLAKVGTAAYTLDVQICEC